MKTLKDAKTASQRFYISYTFTKPLIFTVFFNSFLLFLIFSCYPPVSIFDKTISFLCNQSQKIIQIIISMAKKFCLSTTRCEKKRDFLRYNCICTHSIVKQNHVFFLKKKKIELKKRERERERNLQPTMGQISTICPESLKVDRHFYFFNSIF